MPDEPEPSEHLTTRQDDGGSVRRDELSDIARESISEIMSSAEPFVKSFTEDKEKDRELERDRIASEERKDVRRLWLLGAVTLALFVIVCGLIFFKDDTEAGLSVVTHVGAVAAGLLAGLGWNRAQQNR